MSLTLKMIKTRVRYALGLWRNDGFSAMPEGLLDHIINEAQRNVRIDLKDRTENFSTTLTANQRTYTLPTDFLKEVEVYVERNTSTGFQGYRLDSKSYRELVATQTRYDSENPVSGRVKRYAISDDNLIYFDPIPSAVRMDLFYMALPEEMTSDGNIPDFNEIYHEVVLAKTKEKVAQEIGNTAKFNEFFQTYQAMLGTYRPMANSKQSHSTQIILSY